MARRRSVRDSGTELLASTFAGLGIARVHGGPASLLLAAAFRRHGIDLVEASSSLAATLMAIGEARSTLTLGVVVLSTRSALVAALPGLASARVDGTRLLAVVMEGLAIPPRTSDLDPEALLRPIVENVARVQDASALGPALRTAARHATGAPASPAAVIVPDVVLASEVPSPLPAASDVGPEDPARPADDDVAAAAAAIRRAGSVAIYAGQGAFGAAEALAALAEKLEAPVASTISGRGVLSDDHPLSLGFGFGASAAPFVRKVFEERELVIAVGAAFSEAAIAGGIASPRRLVHIDARREHLHPQAEVAIVSDARPLLEALIQAVPAARRDAELRDRIARGKRQHAASLTRAPADGGVQPDLFFARLRSRLPKDAVLALDPGEPAFWALHAYEVYRPGTLLLPVDLALPGFAVPAAIGVLLASPGRMVVAVTGSGPTLGLELRTATERHLPLPAFVFEPASIAAPAGSRRDERLASRSLDLRAFAQAVGARSVRIASDYDLDAGLDAALAAADRPTVIHVRYLDDRPSPYAKALLAASSGTLGTRMRSFARAFAARLLRD